MGNKNVVEIRLPKYEFYIRKNDQWIRSGNYVRGVIIDEVGDSAYKIKLYMKGEPEEIFYVEDLKFM
jgi:hypothetical protein